MVPFHKKTQKYIEYVQTKCMLLFRQKKFRSAGVLMKYMLLAENSPNLIVVFSAFTRKGLRARYNYVRTLKNVKHSRLFILDDFGDDGRGAYYVGHDMQFDEERATVELIRYIQKKVRAERILFCGSSKGGWAALNIGLQFPGADMIIGGPQYFLGRYLIDSDNQDALRHIAGRVTEEKVGILDGYLEKRIRNNPYKESQGIYLHYSDQEHTWREHIQFSRKTLEEEGYYLEENVAHYANHSDISYYFPEYLRGTVEKLCREERRV